MGHSGHLRLQGMHGEETQRNPWEGEEDTGLKPSWPLKNIIAWGKMGLVEPHTHVETHEKILSPKGPKKKDCLGKNDQGLPFPR